MGVAWHYRIDCRLPAYQELSTGNPRDNTLLNICITFSSLVDFKPFFGARSEADIDNYNYSSFMKRFLVQQFIVSRKLITNGTTNLWSAKSILDKAVNGNILELMLLPPFVHLTAHMQSVFIWLSTECSRNWRDRIMGRKSENSLYMCEFRNVTGDRDNSKILQFHLKTELC